MRNTITLHERDWQTVIEALDNMVTIIDKLDPKMIGSPSYEEKDKYRFMYVLQKLHGRLVEDHTQQFG